MRHVTELITILGGTTIFDKQREDVNNAIMAILMRWPDAGIREA